jgi:tRNA pseudouridine13 synthase
MTDQRAGKQYLTSQIPGIGGAIKESPEDFRVTEIPLYTPSGEGEHLYVEIEKRGITTLEAIRRVARGTGIQERDIGYAGMKDSRGITRQTLSLPRVGPEQATALDIPGLRVLSAIRHRNKLKIGHLAGNRFRVAIRGVADGALPAAEAVLEILRKRGVPNFFGPQRYGAQQNSHLIGRALLMGDPHGAIDAIIGSANLVTDQAWQNAIEAYRRRDIKESLQLFPRGCRIERDILQRLLAAPEAYDKAVRAINPRMKSLYLSAWQSAIFDAILAGRLMSFDRLEAGDLAWKHDNGACFIVEDPDTEASRAEALEISPSGPLFGASMTWPEGIPGVREEDALAKEGLTRNGPAGGWPDRLPGARRPLRVPLVTPSAAVDDNALVLEFSLPKGAYATSLLREVMKDW